jgi:sugar (pentulose or hexulose) kinase
MTSADLLVGIDIGTTRTKATVLGTDGTEICQAQAPTPWRRVPSGAETSAVDLLEAVLTAVGTALEAAPAGQVHGVGVTSMAETLVLVGRDGHPAAPCVAWHDTRGQEESAELTKAFGDGAFGRRTGLAEPPICSLVKLAWYFRHGGAHVRRAQSVADWVVFKLGGEAVSEASLAGRTGALCIADRDWWAEGLEWAGAPADLFPRIIQAGEPAGRVTLGALERDPEVPRHNLGVLGRLSGAALTSAGHDHMSAAVGAGATGPDQVLDSCGTAEGFVRTVSPLDEAGIDRAVAAGISAGWHTVPGMYALLAGQSLGLLLERVLSLLGVDGPDAVAALDRAAQDVSAGPMRVVQAVAYGDVSILDVSVPTSPAALWSAAIDHVSAGAAKIVEAMDNVAGPGTELVLSGGWARCEGLRKRRQKLLPSFRWPAVMEAGARGAALLGGCAAGIFSGPTDFPVPQSWALERQ